MTVVHGGLDEREIAALGLDPASVLDLSANLHPDGPSEAVLAAARSARLDRYPPADAGPLRDAIAEHERVDPACVLPTPGATAAIHLAARALLGPGDAAAILGPAFGEYAAAVRVAGARVVAVEAAPPDFTPRVDAGALEGCRAVFLANPNNPTGSHLSRAAIEAALAGGRTLVLDAAYEAFVDGGWDTVDLVRDGADALVVRSMTKLHAIPGVRLGYLVGPPTLITRVARLQHSWALDAVAHAVGPVALSEHGARVARLRDAWATRERLRDALVGAGVRVAPSLANFLLVEVGNAALTRRALLGRGILVRDCASFGLSGWIRIAVPSAADEARVADALIEMVGEGAR